MELAVKIKDRILPNPVGLASGTCGYGLEMKDYLDLNQLGAIYSKAISLKPRAGNPGQRLQESPCGLLNSIGLANVGLEVFVKEKLPLLEKYSCPIIINVAASTEEEFITIVEELNPYSGVWGYEINISCPNVSKGGMSFGTDPKLVEELTRKLRCKTEKPLIMKLSPNVQDIGEIAAAAENGGADALSCINTLRGMAIDIDQKKPVLARGFGGLSGPAIRPVGIAAVFTVSRRVKIPVIGLGGISCGRDAVEYLLAGASAIQIGTANFLDPEVAISVLDYIKDYMKKHKLLSIYQFKEILADWQPLS